MRFQHQRGVVKKTGQTGIRGIFSKVLLLISVIGIAAGLYLLLLVLTPNIPVLYPVQRIDAKNLPRPSGDRIYIPKIGVNVPIGSSGEEALNDGVWHRFPERGDPKMGGNFIVSAHRFSIGLTPGETRKQSPFYHIDKLAVGDQIMVDFAGKRYGYEITDHSSVKPTQVEIEAESQQPQMTLYTCTLKGETDGREVFIAKPLGEVKNGMVARPPKQ